MSEPYDDIQDMLGSREQDFLEDQYGGYENFMASYGLKPWDDDDMDVGFDLIHQFADGDQPPGLEDILKAVKQEENVSEVKQESQEPQMEIEEDVKPSVKNEEEETSL